MWLKVAPLAAKEERLRLVNLGYEVLAEVEDDCRQQLGTGAFVEGAAVKEIREVRHGWLMYVEQSISGIFPTDRERHILRRIARRVLSGNDQVHQWFWAEIDRFDQLVDFLDELRLTGLRPYTGLPPASDRLFVENIDSFVRVRDVNPKMVAGALRDGRVELAEDIVQRALEQLLDVPFHRRDHGGEINDLYTANVVVNGRRTPTAFMLKGRGCRARELQIGDCGKNGDQLLRLFNSPAVLLVVQYVGMVSDNVIADLQQKVQARRAARQPTWFAVIDGQDTARLLRAYGFELPDGGTGLANA